MEKIKGSILAKMIAWILISVSGTVMVISLLIGALFYEDNVYDSYYFENKSKQMIEEVGEQYAVKVMRDRELGTNLAYFKDTNFRYGLMKSDDIDKVDFNHAKYIESNLPANVKKDDLEIYYMPTNDKTIYYFEDSIFTFHDRSIYHFSEESRYTLYIDSICFDKQKGVFYYHASENDTFYPIKRVCITFDGTNYHYSYQYDVEQYTLDYYEDDNSTSESYIAEADDMLMQNIGNQKDSILEILTNEAGMDFGKLNETAFNCDNWNRMVFDNIREYSALDESLTIIQIKDNTKMVTGDKDYYLDDYYTLHVKLSDAYENYYVVVLPPEKIVADFHGDLYERAMYLLNFVEKYKYSIWVIFAVSAMITFALFIILMCGAGYRRNKETKEIYLQQTFWQKVPLEVEWILYCAINVFIITLCTVIIQSNEIDKLIIYFLFFGLLVAWLTLAELLNCAVRVKAGKWWKYTCCYWMISKLKKYVWCPLRYLIKKIVFGPFKYIAVLYQNRKIIWKFWLLFAGYKCIEGFIVILLGIDFESFFLLSIFEIVTFGIFSSLCIIQMQKLQEQSCRLAKGNYQEPVDTSKMFSAFKQHGENLNHIGEGITKAVEEKMKSEYFKTELITNVSHDIKTPLTSIINYVDLLGKEELNNDKAEEYLEILVRQSTKLKKLIEDLVEASKASSGNLPVTMEKLDLHVFLTQTVGEWTERLEQEKLELVVTKPEETVYINADGRHLWRVVDNLLNNICKYAQPGSRVYISIEKNQRIQLIFKNISKIQLNIAPEELLERFVQGDKSRNSSGHGLGLSIAQSLMNLMHGDLQLIIDGDLFKVILSFEEV